MSAHDHGPAMHEGEEAPPPGVGVMAALRWLLLLGVIAAAGVAWWSYARADPASDHAPRYMCPMHPQITSPDPGECPICHMALEPIADARASSPPVPKASPAAAAKTYACPMHPDQTSTHPGTCPLCKMDLVEAAAAKTYACPMHPDQTSTHPGTCPLCKMDLVEVAAAKTYACPMHPDQTSDHPGSCPICNMDLVEVAAKEPAAPPGTTTIALGLDRLQAIGVRTAEATRHTFTPTLRAAAITEFAESGAARVHVRAPGFVESIAVDEVGVRVRKGQKLAEYYSPEIYQAQLELIAARGWSGGQALTAGRQRLELLGVSAAAIDRLIKSGKPDRTVAIVAPASGVVVAREVVLGAYVSPEQPLYELREDRALYLVAEVPAARAGALAAGTKGQVRFPGRPELALELAVDLVYPSVSDETRSVRARLPLANAGRELRAGEYATVEFALPGREGVAVPREAVLETGGPPYLFVDLGDGVLAPRTVTLGRREDALVEVVAGVQPGERVVASAAFLVDAESRLRAALVPAEPAP